MYNKFVKNLKIKEGDTVIYHKYVTDENGSEWEEEHKAFVYYYVDDTKINLKLTTNKYVWVNISEIVGKQTKEVLTEKKRQQIQSKIDKLESDVEKIQSNNVSIHNENILKKIENKIKLIDELNKQLEDDNVTLWIEGYEPIEDED